LLTELESALWYTGIDIELKLAGGVDGRLLQPQCLLLFAEKLIDNLVRLLVDLLVVMHLQLVDFLHTTGLFDEQCVLIHPARMFLV